jgi:membrane protein involved in colicin uptake
MLDLPRKTIEDNPTTIGQVQQPTEVPQEQIVITAEQTQQHLELLIQAEKESAIAQAKAEELAKEAELARIEAEEQAEIAEEEAARLAKENAERTAEAARLAKVDAEKKAAILVKAEAEDKQRRIAQLEAEERAVAESCSDTQCYHEGKCRSKPNDAICAPTDPDNAWVCTA